MSRPTRGWYARHFRPEEFACRCGCETDLRWQELHIGRPLVMALDELREACGFPLVVSSGYRCPAHNAQVSSTGTTGPHTTGLAVDLAVSRTRAWELLGHAAGTFTGIGIAQHGGRRFIHLDLLTEPDYAPRPTVWSYP